MIILGILFLFMFFFMTSLNFECHQYLTRRCLHLLVSSCIWRELGGDVIFGHPNHHLPSLVSALIDWALIVLIALRVLLGN